MRLGWRRRIVHVLHCPVGCACVTGKDIYFARLHDKTPRPARQSSWLSHVVVFFSRFFALVSGKADDASQDAPDHF